MFHSTIHLSSSLLLSTLPPSYYLSLSRAASLPSFSFPKITIIIPTALLSPLLLLNFIPVLLSVEWAGWPGNTKNHSRYESFLPHTYHNIYFFTVMYTVHICAIFFRAGRTKKYPAAQTPAGLICFHLFFFFYTSSTIMRSTPTQEWE